MIATPKLVFQPILPELILAGVAMVGLLYEAIAKRSDRAVHLWISLAGLLAAAAASVVMWNWTGDATVMGGMVSADRFAVAGTVILLAVAAMGLLYGAHYFGRSGDEPRGEFYPLVLFATAGMVLIVAAANLIVTFLALEVLRFSLYVLDRVTGRRGSTRQP